MKLGEGKKSRGRINHSEKERQLRGRMIREANTWQTERKRYEASAPRKVRATALWNRRSSGAKSTTFY